MLGLKRSPLHFLQVQTRTLYLYVCADLSAFKPSCVMVVLLLLPILADIVLYS